MDKGREGMDKKASVNDKTKSIAKAILSSINKNVNNKWWANCFKARFDKKKKKRKYLEFSFKYLVNKENIKVSIMISIK